MRPCSSRSEDRGAHRREVQDAEVPIGVLAYLDDNVVGWTRVVPRWTLPRITENRALASTPSPSAIFTGTLALFQRAGFTELGRTYPTWPVMRHKLMHP